MEVNSYTVYSEDSPLSPPSLHTHPESRVFPGRAARNSAHGVLLLFRSVLPRGNSNGVSRALRRALRAKYTNRLMRVSAGAVLPDHLGFIARAASGRRLCGGRRSP